MRYRLDQGMFTRRGAIPFIGLGLLVGCGTEPGESLQYFPLTVGNTWTYAPEDPFYGQPCEWVVTERQGGVPFYRFSAGASRVHGADLQLLLQQRSQQAESGRMA